MRTDPRIRQTWNQFSQNLESANESAQVNLFTFSEKYINPCFSSIGACLQSCTAPCLPNREDRLRRNRGRRRGRAEYGFDFYDDWENDDLQSDGLLGWDNDHLDRLLAGSGEHAEDGRQPGRQRSMSYGARRDMDGRLFGGRGKGNASTHDGEHDPTIIPNTSIFGFLGRLPWKAGGKGLKYKPSAADLRDRSAAIQEDTQEAEPLLEEHEEGEEASQGGRGKQGWARRDGSGSDSVSDSIRSRADLFPSDGEDDAVPLDDEFAMALERRTTTGSGTDDQASGRARSKRTHKSQASGMTESSKATPPQTEKRKRGGSASTGTPSEHVVVDSPDVPSLEDLKNEEEALRREEEEAIERKRMAAIRLASQKGLSTEGTPAVCLGDV